MAEGQNLRIDYIEMVSRDLVATKAFYTMVFGWDFTDYGNEYTSFTDGRLSGGFRSDLALGPVSAACLVVIYTDDLEKTQAAVEAAGGRTFNLHDFPGGRRFHFHDPSGNELAVWTDR